MTVTERFSVSEKLKDQTLFRTDSYIDGEWVGGETSFEVTNPADRSVIAAIPDVGEAGADLLPAAAV